MTHYRVSVIAHYSSCYSTLLWCVKDLDVVSSKMGYSRNSKAFASKFIENLLSIFLLFVGNPVSGVPKSLEKQDFWVV